MSHSRTLNSKINYLHGRALQIDYRNYNCSYKNLLKMDQSFTVLQRNIQFSVIELFKVKQNISTHMINNIFQMRDNLRYNLKSQTKFFRSSANTSQYGLHSLRVLSSRVWTWYQQELKTAHL